MGGLTGKLYREALWDIGLAGSSLVGPAQVRKGDLSGPVSR